MIPAPAAALLGTGSHLTPSGTVITNFPAVGTPFVDNGGGNFTGTWSAPAQADWIGSFAISGADPRGNAPGTSSYNFSTLTTNALPAGSWFLLGDLDNGTGASETVLFTAYDASHTLITSPWLDSTLLAEKDNASPGSPVALTDMPGWDWNAATGTYTFNGGTVPGNPAISLALGSNQPITYLDATIPGSTSFVYHVEAPVPEPSSLALLSGSLIVLLVRRRRVH